MNKQRSLFHSLIVLDNVALSFEMHLSPKSFVSALLSLSLFPSLSLAQQYAGDKINNTLQAVAGSELAFFKIHDSKNQSATLLNYYSLASNGSRINPANAKRAVIIIHGLLRDPYLYINNVMKALAMVPDPAINKDNVYSTMLTN